MAILPCDICGKTGHAWFQCPKRSTKPANWKPDRLRPRKDRATVTATTGQPLPSGGSSAVEQVASNHQVEGSTPSPRSKDSAPAADAQLEGGKRSAKPKVKASNARVTRKAPKVSAVPDGGSSKKPKTRAKKSTGASQRRAQTATGVGTGGDNLGSGSRSSAPAKTDVPTHQSQASGDGQSQHNSGVRVDPVDTPTKRRGRPATGFDKAAYNRKYMKNKRAAKAAKEQK